MPSHFSTTTFENDFWDSFRGEKRLTDILTHFVTEFSNTLEEHKQEFAEKIIGQGLIVKRNNSEKLLAFVEEELSKLEIKPVKEIRPRANSNTKKQEGNTIYDVDRLTGTQFEEFMEKLLDANGYSNSHVTGKAGDQGGDILTNSDDEKFIIQAKNYALNRKVTNSAVQEVLGAIAYYGADQGVVVTNSFFTKSAIELAEVNNITLWDRRIVTQMIEGYNNQKDKPKEETPKNTKKSKSNSDEKMCPYCITKNPQGSITCRKCGNGL